MVHRFYYDTFDSSEVVDAAVNAGGLRVGSPPAPHRQSHNPRGWLSQHRAPKHRSIEQRFLLILEGQHL
jgi:hypothetical protein